MGHLGEQLAAKKVMGLVLATLEWRRYSREGTHDFTVGGFHRVCRNPGRAYAEGNLRILATVAEKLKDPKRIIRHLNKGMIVRLATDVN